MSDSLGETEKYLPCAPKALILNLHTAAYWQTTHKHHHSCSRETLAHRLLTVLLKNTNMSLINTRRSTYHILDIFNIYRKSDIAIYFYNSKFWFSDWLRAFSSNVIFY